jgi:hypothetical protein
MGLLQHGSISYNETLYNNMELRNTIIIFAGQFSFIYIYICFKNSRTKLRQLRTSIPSSLFHSSSEAFMVTARNEVFSGDQSCQYGVGIQSFGDYLGVHRRGLMC